jgi:DNA-binding response OmpR family regulator
MRRRILVLEERNESRADLALSLKALGYQVDVLGFGGVLDRAGIEQTDLILLRMPEAAGLGLQALSDLRSLPYYPPLIAIVEDQNPSQAAMLLECGCDSVLAGSPDILQVKTWMEALLRRSAMYQSIIERSEAVLRVGDLEIDVPARMVRTKTKTSELTDREMKLLLELAQKPGIVCRRAELLERVWGSAAESLTATLNTYVNRLRMKIEDDLRSPKLLIGVYGVGYRLMVGSQHSEGETEAAGDRRLAAFPVMAQHLRGEVTVRPARKRSPAASRQG